MTSLQKINLGTPPGGTDGDTTRTAFTKLNSNIDVITLQDTLTSATPITAPATLNISHVGKRVNLIFATAGTLTFPPANVAGPDSVILLRNSGAAAVTLAANAATSDTLGLTKLGPSDSALFDTDGVSTWGVLYRSLAPSPDLAVTGKLSVAGDATLANVTASGTLGVKGVSSFGSAGQATISATGSYSGPSASYTGNVSASTLTGRLSNTSYAFVTSTANSTTVVSAAPSGSGTTGQFISYGVSDTANSPYVAMYSTGAVNIINSARQGSGSVLPLDIYVNSAFNARFFPTGGVGFGSAFFTPASTGAVHVSTATYQIVLKNTAQTDPGRLWLIGPNTANNIVVFNGGAVGCYIVDGATSWSGQSDGNLKNIRSDLSGALEAVKDIRTVRYTWKSDDAHNEALGEPDDARVHIGVIAQDVRKHLPEAVSDTGNGYLGVQYTDLVPLAMAAIKELSAKVDAQAALIEKLQAAQ